MKTYGGFLLSQIRQISGRVFDQLLKDIGIDEFNGAQGRILYVLWEHKDLTISDIGRLTSLANTTLTSMLDRMEKSGLIERKRNEKNRKQIFITLTNKAQQLKSDYEKVSNQTNEIFYNGFIEEEIVRFENDLRRILNNFERIK